MRCGPCVTSLRWGLSAALGRDDGLKAGSSTVVLQHACELAVKVLDGVLVVGHQLQVSDVLAPAGHLLCLQNVLDSSSATLAQCQCCSNTGLLLALQD